MLQKMMFSLLALLVILIQPAQGCVGRFLYVGALDQPEEKVMAEMLVLLINERTGTTVKVRYFENNEELYKALRAEAEEERVDIIVEDTLDAAAVLGRTPGSDLDAEFTAVKQGYEEQLQIVWLNPFGFSAGKESKSMSAPLLRLDVLNNFPLLPRVLNKLAGGIDDEAYQKLMEEAGKGEKPRNIARDFLESKRFI